MPFTNLNHRKMIGNIPDDLYSMKSVVVNCTWPAIVGWYSMVWYAGTVPNLDNYRLKGLEEPKISIKIKITVKARLG